MLRRLLVLLLLFAAPAQALAASHAVVLMYHRFGEDRWPTTNIRLGQLATHIRLLKQGGYHVLPLTDILAARREGRDLPDKTVAITVDDAYASFASDGWPMFKAAGFPVTLFVSTEPLGQRGFLSWDQLRTLRDEGVTLGLHGHDHPHLPELSADAQRADLEAALALFQSELTLRPTLFAYPYGEADAASLRLVRDLGLTAFGQHSGVLAAGDDPAWLPRFALNEHYGETDRFLRVVDALPIAATQTAPTSPTVGPKDANPPPFAFTVTDDSLDLSRLSCFGPDGQAAPLAVEGRAVSVALTQRLSMGRSRINCTLPGPRGDDGGVRWHWRGTQFVVPAQPAR